MYRTTQKKKHLRQSTDSFDSLGSVFYYVQFSSLSLAFFRFRAVMEAKKC